MSQVGHKKKNPGFDFLGYRFGPDGLGVAEATIRKFALRASRLYEQERERPDGPSLLGMYVRRWVGWAKGGWGDAVALCLHPAGGLRLPALATYLAGDLLASGAPCDGEPEKPQSHHA